VAGKVVALEHLAEVNVLAVDIQLTSGWRGHAAGQFAFVTFMTTKAPSVQHCLLLERRWTHPFLIKGLGDYTRSLPARLHIGDTVTVEGPYGCFDFRSEQPRQIWIGGGIGIAPSSPA
jgi:predicted ferric reductase